MIAKSHGAESIAGLCNGDSESEQRVQVSASKGADRKLLYLVLSGSCLLSLSQSLRRDRNMPSSTETISFLNS